MNHHLTPGRELTRQARLTLAALAGGLIAVMSVGASAAGAHGDRGRALQTSATARSAHTARPRTLTAPLTTSGTAVKLVVSVPGGAPAAGAQFTLVAKAVNSSGGIDKSFDGTASWSDLSGSLSPSSPSDFVNGVSTTTGAAIADAYRHDRITVTSGSLTGTGPAFNVTGALARFTLAGIGKVAGQPFTVKITAEDSLGDVITSYSGSPSWSDGSGSLSPAAPAAFVKGVSTTTAQISSPAHADRLTVTDTSAGVQSQSAAFNVVGPLDHFAFAAIPTVAQNQQFTIRIYAEDSLGDVIPSYGGSPSWSDSSGSLSPSAPATFVKGVSTTAGAQIADADPADKITVSDPSAGVQSASAAFDVTASTFTSPGSYGYTVPAGITSINVTVIGAAGGLDGGCFLLGGRGAAVSATLTVTPGEHLYVGVGGTPDCVTHGVATGGGTGGGGAGGAGNLDGGGGGGGASVLAVGFPDFGRLLMVAAGGGGASFNYAGGDAGSPGPPTSGCGPASVVVGCGGGAGTSSGGGAGGAGDGQPGDSAGTAGGSLLGGAGGTGNFVGGGSGGGGGGGGYYGGGAGGGGDIAGGGGGGSSFVDPSATNASGPTPTGDSPEVAITINNPSPH